MKNNQILLSIIIPIYNSEKYLNNLFNSLNQFDENVEFILINDGSIDESKTICEKFVSQKLNCTLINKANGGVSSARNEGIRISKGKYLTFIDPDDTYKDSFYENLKRIIKDYDYDMICWGFTKRHMNNQSKEVFCLPKCNYCYSSNSEILVNLFPRLIGYSLDELSNYFKFGQLPFDIKEWGSVWHFAFKKSIVLENNLFFNENIYLNEDSMFICNYLLYANNIFTIDKCLYEYHIYSEGAFSKKVNFEKILNNKIELANERNKINKLSNKDISSLYDGSLVLSAFQLLLYDGKKDYKSYKKYVSIPCVKSAIKNMKICKKINYRTIFALFFKLKLQSILFLLVKIFHVKSKI